MGEDSIKPWKRKLKKTKKLKENFDSVEILVKTSISSPATLSSPEKVVEFDEQPSGFKSNQNVSFKGERGGSAEDADLLAELRAISMNSSNNRFDTNEDNSQENDTESCTFVQGNEMTKEIEIEASPGEPPTKPWKEM